MKRFKKFGAIIFLSAYLFIGLGLALPSRSLAADAQFIPQIGIPGSEFQQETGTTIGTPGTNATTGEAVMRSDLLARYIAAFYNWGFGIVGVIAVLMLMAAGVIWLTSGGDSGKIGNAKKMIEGALMGAGLLVGSWFLLNTINPNLTNLPAIEMTIIKQVKIGCCDAAKDDSTTKMTTSSNCKDGAGFDENKNLVLGKCELEVCCVFNFSGNQVSNCFTSFSNNCSYFKTGKAVDSSCSDLSECKKDPSIIANCSDGDAECKNPSLIVDCSNVRDGEVPSGAFAKKERLICYNGRVYPSDNAQLSEPCGIKNGGYGICVKSEAYCNDRNNSGGRLCGNNLKCCLD